MLDIRLIRRDPDAVRRRWRAAGRRGRGARPRARARRALAALTTELEQLRAEQNAASKALQGRAEPRAARAARRAVGPRPRAVRRARPRLRAERDAALASLPNLPADDAPDQDTVLREVGEAEPDRARPPGARRAADRHGARRAAVGLALRLPARRAGAAGARARPLRAGEARRRGLRAGDPAGARARAGAVRHRLPARHRAADLPPARRRPVPGRHLRGRARLAAPRRDPRRRELPLRYAGLLAPASAARPAPPGKDTRGIFRVHQFDKVEMFCFVEPDAAGDEHERLLAIEESIMQELEIPYRVVNIAVDDLGASAAKKYDMRGVAARPGPLPRADVVLEHDRLPGAAAGHPLPPGRGQAGAPGTRSTAPRSRSGGRSSRCWRTASRRTARCAAGVLWCADGRARRCLAAGADRRAGCEPTATATARGRAAASASRPSRREAAHAAPPQRGRDGPQRRRRPSRARPAPPAAARRWRSGPACGRRRCSTGGRSARGVGVIARAACGDRGGEAGAALGLGVGGDEQLGDGPVDRGLLADAQQRLGLAGHRLDQQRRSRRRGRRPCWTGRRPRGPRAAARARRSADAGRRRRRGAIGRGAAQCPQNHSHGGGSSPPSTSLSAGL